MILLTYAISTVCFAFSLYCNNMVLNILSIPAICCFSIVIHEMGHCIGCIINHNAITMVSTPLFAIKGNKVYIANTFIPKCYCGFIKNNNNALAYIGGPIMSLLLILVLTHIMIKTKILVIQWFVIIAGIVFMVNILPYKNNDMMMFCRELRKNK